jgi:uncharacterized membrane protein YeaQ/YmgE (transglycosylase-associated protein family)
MDLVVWMLTGAALGWLAYSHLGLNQDRGLATSIIIGAVGGVIGGRLVAPMFAPGELSIATVLLAGAVAAAVLAASNAVHKRWGV